MSPQITCKLRPHQIAPAEHLLSALQRHRSAVDFSDTGTGKTYVACAVATALNLPTLIVVPKIAMTAWHRVAEHFGETFSVINYEKLRTGKTPYGSWQKPLPVEAPETQETLRCQCCQQSVLLDPQYFRPCYCHPAGIHCVVVQKSKKDYGQFNFDSGVRAVIFDEVHRCGGLRSLNAEMLVAAKRQRLYILGLSATAACNPLQMRALGYALDLHTLTPAGGLGFYDWARRYGCRRDPHFQGFKWLVGEKKQIEVMREICSHIFPQMGLRVRCSDIPGFPEREISAELYDLDSHGQLESCYREMAAALEQVDRAAAHDANADHPLTKILRARQRIELLKVPLAVELAEDYLAKGYSVAVFANFRLTVDELSTRLDCSAIIDGSSAGVRDRQKHVDDFQSNSIRRILVNSEAGGICLSLHDLYGNVPRIGLVFPCFSATTMRQVFGRLHRDGGKSRCHYRVLFAAGTCESAIARALRAKSNNLDALNDADLMPENFRLTKMPMSGTL